MHGADSKMTKGVQLNEVLYIPEPFFLERKDEISQRRMAKFATVMQEGISRQLLLIIGEVKEISVAKYGHKFVLKHLPDCHIMCNDDLHKRLERRFSVELELWNSIETSHLMFIGTVSIGVTGIASLHEVALMNVDSCWIPFENAFEKAVIDRLIETKRKFTRCLRYNMNKQKLIASALITDVQPPEACFVIPPGVEGAVEDELDKLKVHEQFSSWVWKVGEGGMPSFSSKSE